MNRAFRDVIRWKSSVAHLQSSPKTLSASEVRKTFLDYFCEENGHLYIRSSPVFSLKDPTLAFTNAGMNQFKKVFLGLVEPAFSKVANSQKCIRIGGMHNDLSQVGKDGTHHTFFEMLGNWSFGDYFKEEACRLSWDLLTKVYNIPPERLYVTYFKGDLNLGLEKDLEVKEIWRKIGVEDSHILAFGAQENFWSGSVTGPCGPCTEIHYDHSGRTNAGSLVNTGTNEVTELWNLVFTQYDRKPDGNLTKLNTHFVDTGMGFERLVAVLQGKMSNYDTDLFLPLFDVIKNHTGHSGYTGQYNDNPMDSSYRVLADHSRMIAVALSDGMIPNHQSKVRGIIKRALTVVEKSFNAKPDLLKELTVHAAQSLSDAYPEIEKNLPKIHYIIDEEAEIIKMKQDTAANQWKKLKKFYPALQDLDIKDVPQIIEGLNYINKNVLSQGKKALSSENIFALFETYGIPVVQMQEIALKLDLHFDMDAYKEYETSVKESDKKIAQKKFLSGFNEYSYINVLTKLEEKKIQPTLDYFKYDYRADDSGKYIFKDQPTTVEAILVEDNLVDEISAEDVKDGKEIGLILDRTQLFSEDGGQASDSGTLEIENDIVFDIEKLYKVKNYVIHFGRFRNFPSDSKLAVQSLGIVKINEDKRQSLMRNHTALHLLNSALRQELNVVGEKFSNVTPEHLTLNIMIYRNTLNGTEGLKKLEKFVKDFILHGVSVNRKILNHQQFQSLNDVVFIPGEAILNREIPVIEINSGFKLTKEYCTGTHVLNTSHLQDFVIMKFVKGSYNVNYIEAITGEKCSQIRKTDSEYKEKCSCLEKKISECGFNNPPSEVNDLLEKAKELHVATSESNEISQITKFEINEKMKEARKNLTALMEKAVRNYITEEIKKASSSTPENFIVHQIDCCWEFDPTDLEEAASVHNNKPLLIFFKQKNSLSVQCIVPETFVSKKFSAQQWLVDSLISFSGIASCKKHQNPNLIFYISGIKASEAQLKHVMNIGIEFAQKNITR